MIKKNLPERIHRKWPKVVKNKHKNGRNEEIHGMVKVELCRNHTVFGHAHAKASTGTIHRDAEHELGEVSMQSSNNSSGTAIKRNQ